MKILVLGGNQFLGKTLCKKLLELGHRVYALNRGTRENSLGVIHLKADRNNTEELKKVVSNIDIDIVIDISGYEPKQVEIFYKVMKENFKQYIYISSASIYNNVQSYPINEDEVIGKNEIWGVYAENKYLSEMKIKELFKKTFYTIFRPFYIYGIGNNLNRENYIFSRIENNLPIYLPNKGEEIVQFGYVDDLVNAIIYSFNNKEFYNNIFNISGNEAVTFNQYVKICGKVAKKDVKIKYVNLEIKKLKARDWFPFRDVHLFGNINKVLATGFKNKYTLFEGLSLTYNYLKNNKLLEYPSLYNIEKE